MSSVAIHTGPTVQPMLQPRPCSMSRSSPAAMPQWNAHQRHQQLERGDAEPVRHPAERHHRHVHPPERAGEEDHAAEHPGAEGPPGRQPADGQEHRDQADEGQRLEDARGEQLPPRADREGDGERGRAEQAGEHEGAEPPGDEDALAAAGHGGESPGRCWRGREGDGGHRAGCSYQNPRERACSPDARRRPETTAPCRADRAAWPPWRPSAGPPRGGGGRVRAGGAARARDRGPAPRQESADGRGPAAGRCRARG